MAFMLASASFLEVEIKRSSWVEVLAMSTVLTTSCRVGYLFQIGKNCFFMMLLLLIRLGEIHLGQERLSELIVDMGNLYSILQALYIHQLQI